MDVVQTTAQTATQQVTQSTEDDSRFETSISSDFDMFLSLLTTQLKNQDPLNPMESQEFAVQLATFSSVEQQALTNDLLKEMVDGFGSSQSNIESLASWVGMEARLSGPIAFNGAPVKLAPDSVPDHALSNFLVVTDSDGNEVSREYLSTVPDTVFWGGTDSEGNPLPYGDYSFGIESFGDAGSLGIMPVSHYRLVQEARLSDGETELVFEGGQIMSSDAVVGLRQAQPDGEPTLSQSVRNAITAYNSTG